MFSLLSDIKLWSCDDNINIKDTDFGAFRYNDKKTEGLYDEGKRSYCHNRGIIYTPVNKKGKKLKDGLRYLEEQLREHSIIYSEWHDQNTLQLMLNTGLLIYIQIKIPTADIDQIGFDKYLVGKVPDHLSDAVITKENLVCTQNDSQVTILHFTKSKRHEFEKMSKLEPKLVTVDLCGPTGRRIEKKIRVNRTGDLILIWWKSTSNEVYPWSPAMKEHDRANVHLYRLRGVKFELLCYLRTEFDPLSITFNSRQENVLHSIEQKVSRKGEVTIEWQTYQVSQQDKLQRIEVVSIPLPTHTSCAKFSPNQDMLLLCCIDGSITLHDHPRGTNATAKAGFIPTLASWHSDCFLFTVGNERGQCQHYDISLSCIKNQLLNEDSTQSNILDLSSYFRSQPALLQISWSKKVDEEIYYNDRYKNRDSILLLSFESFGDDSRGPLGAMRIVEGSNLTGDVLVFKYLNSSLPDRATSLLLSMNWDNQPRICMHSLNQILNHLFKLQLIPERESLIQDALGSFHVPVRPISQAVEEEYGDEIRDLTRRFFHHLMRYKLFEKAFRLAIDLNDHDLFMDIHYYALVVNDLEMARAAKEKAEFVLSRSNSCTSSHSTCSRPSCSLCSDSPTDNDSESYTGESGSESPHRRSKFSKSSSTSQIPPLPVLPSNPFTPIPLVSTSFNEMSSSPRKPRNTPIKPFPYKFLEINPSNSENSLKNPFPKISTSFSNLKISEIQKRPQTFRRTLSNDRFYHSKIPDKSPSTPHDLTTIEIPNSIEYSFMTLSTNMTSTSFITDENIPNFQIPEVKNPQKTPEFSEVSRHFFTSENNLVSTSFNEEEDQDVEVIDDDEHDDDDDDDDLDDSEKSSKIKVPPPPPEMTSSLANYLSCLPMKNLPISRSSPGLSEIDELIRFSSSRVGRIQGVKTQSSVSTILQNRRRENLKNSGTYRLNYDLDLNEGVHYSGSFEDLRAGMGIFGGGGGLERGRGSRMGSNVPPLPVVGGRGGGQGVEGFGGSEKPKVKFSNTVTHILVPGSGQGYRPLQRPVTKLHPMDPKRELAESLPLCLGNEDYLKDFQPLSKDSGGEEKPKEPIKTEETAKIKVVHFGLL